MSGGFYLILAAETNFHHKDTTTNLKKQKRSNLQSQFPDNYEKFIRIDISHDHDDTSKRLQKQTG
ncbi:hypothetical protein KML24007_14880 [Alistipes indistinctus]|jgi:hypothetical protein